MLLRVRERASLLVAIGTCAVWGGVAAMKPEADWRELLYRVYGHMADAYKASQARALSEIVRVDAKITGCPIEKHEILAALADLLRGSTPRFPVYPVCTECRIRENKCLLIDERALCSGPLTIAGCGARCPSLGVACIGCRGPAPDANYASALKLYEQNGHARADVLLRLGTFTPLPNAGQQA
jgi:coenzyme F420-reducing hydrogenase gamma subunit